MDDTERAADDSCTTFLVEHYWPGVTQVEFGAAAERLRTSADELIREGRLIRHLHSTLVPHDETAFSVLEAESQALVEETYARARVRFERVLEAVESPRPARPEAKREES